MLNLHHINLKIHNEAFYRFLQGGNKARKLKYILEHAKSLGSNAIVSAGSASSNHARDCALACAQLGWKCKLIIHDREDYSHSNLFLMKLAGAELQFCNLSKVSYYMDEAMLAFEKEGYTPYYIWGGGHSVHGAKALMDAVSEFVIENPNWIPDYVIVASGTGGTQAGLHVGFSQFSKATKVIGISVARSKSRGEKAVSAAVEELAQFCNIEKSQISSPVFLDDWIGKGYGTTYPQLFEVIRSSATNGILTDPTYTGKAMCGLYNMVQNGYIEKGANVLFWHTGGMLNLVDAKNALMEQIN